MCDVPFPQCGQWRLHCNASCKGVLSGYWIRLRETALDSENTPIVEHASVFPLTSYLDQSGLARFCSELTSDKATIALPLIMIYPASCDVAMSGIDLAFEAVTAKPDDELCMTVLQTWKRMLELNIVLPDYLQSSACRALMKCDSNSVAAAAFFLEHLFDPCAEAPDHSDVRDLLLHFNMDATLVDLLINKWKQSALISDKVSIVKFQAMRICLVSDSYSPPPAAGHASYPSRQAAASRFFDEIMAYLTANPDLVARELTERVLRALRHYELDPSFTRLVPLLQQANLAPSELISVVRLINSMYDLIQPPDQTTIYPEDHGKCIAWTSLTSLLPELDHWEPALFGVDMSLAALTATPSTEQVMAILRTWKQLLDWCTPAASSITLIQATVDCLVSMSSSTCIEPAHFFIEQLYTPTATWTGPSFLPFYLDKLLFHCNMDSTLVDAFLSKWHSVQDAALLSVKCACLYRCLFEIKTDGSKSTATYVIKTDPMRYSNQVKAYCRIVDEMLACFRAKPSLISKHVNSHLLHGIAYYCLEAKYLPCLISVIKDAKLDKQVHDSLLKGVPDKCKVDTKTAPIVSTNYLVITSAHRHWLMLQKVLSPELCTWLSVHRRLLLDKVSTTNSAAAVLIALAAKDKLDMYLRNLYTCIGEEDADLPLLLEFTAQCEHLPLSDLASIAAIVSRISIGPPQLKLTYYRLVHKLVAAVCELPSFSWKVVNGRAAFVSTIGNAPILYSDSVRLVLHYLGFTIDVIVDNILSRRPAATLTVEAYDKINLAVLCPLDSELEPQNSSSSIDSSARLTVATRATRMQLFEKFMSKWSKAFHQESIDSSLLANANDRPVFSVTCLIERLDYLQGKLRSLPPAADKKYILPQPSARLPADVLAFLQGTLGTTTIKLSGNNNATACQALVNSIKQELSTTYLKDAIDVRPSRLANGKHCVSLTKVCVTLDDECRSISTRIQDLLTKYAKAKLEALPAAGHLGYSEEQTLQAKVAVADFVVGSCFPVILQSSTTSMSIDPLPSSSSSTSQPVATAIAAANNPNKEQQDLPLQVTESGHKRPAVDLTLSPVSAASKKAKLGDRKDV